MEQGLQKLNADRRLALWTQRITDCRSSGASVKRWCQENGVSEKTYYHWQKRIFKAVQEQQHTEFTEVHGIHPVSSVTASFEVSGVNVQIYAGADEQTLHALLRALKTC